MKVSCRSRYAYSTNTDNVEIAPKRRTRADVRNAEQIAGSPTCEFIAETSSAFLLRKILSDTHPSPSTF